MIGRSILVGLVAAALFPVGGNAYRKAEQGNERYLSGLYEDALRTYTEAQVDAPESAELYYDIGNVLYRQGEFEGSAEAFTRALADAGQELVGPAAYNLGNARYRQQSYEEAIEAFEQALAADPADLDAKRNLELALRALEQQRRQEQQGEEQQQQEEPEEQEQPQSEEEEQPEEPAQQPEPEPQPPEGEEQEPAPEGQMTPEQAERMLDGLEEQERENLRSQALQQPRPTRETTGADW
jgi:Ca-activated chloride channel family protein